MLQSARNTVRIDVQPDTPEAFGSRSVDRVARVLIADDDPSILRLLADHCARLGFNVDTASNGIQALLKASRIKPDILIVDVNMPEVDGLSVCAHVLEPDRTPVDVIVMTGSRNTDTPDRCEGFGAYYALKGPTFWNDLEAALAEIAPQTFISGKSGAPAQSPTVRTRPCVLLIDDDNDVNRFLASRLEKCGIEVKYANDSQQGFRMACKEEPTVIVTDYFMPNGDAQYLLTRLRTTVATENIPVIVFSGRQLNDMVIQSLQREICGRPGATQILRKSPDTHALFGALQKFCGFEQDRRTSM
jgi:DNA-binding response OmpR family regulator